MTAASNSEAITSSMRALPSRIRSEANISDRPGQLGRLELIATEVEALLVAATRTESATLATNGLNRGDDTSETANGPQIRDLRPVLIEALRPFVQCGDRYCGTLPGGNARCQDCCDLVTTATGIVVSIVERRPWPIPAPVDSGAIGRLNEALGAVDRARLQTAAWSTCNGGRSGVDLLYAVVEAIVREHVEAALAGVVSMDRRSTRIDTCMHCGDLVISFGDGFWSHYRGPGSLLTRCQHSVPYVKDAAPTEGGRYHRIDREHADRALAEVEQRIEAELICCDIYERLCDKPTPEWSELERSEYRMHSICYWGTAAQGIVRAARQEQS